MVSSLEANSRVGAKRDADFDLAVNLVVSKVEDQLDLGKALLKQATERFVANHNVNDVPELVKKEPANVKREINENALAILAEREQARASEGRVRKGNHTIQI